MALQVQSSETSYRAAVSLADLPADAYFVYYNTFSMCFGNAVPSTAVFAQAEGGFCSDDVVVVGSVAASKYILVGALTAWRSLTHFRVVRRGGRFQAVEVVQPYIKPGEPPEELLVLAGEDWRELLQEYALRVAVANGREVLRPARNLTGYCTWYYYYAGVTEKDFLSNVKALGRNRKYRSEVIQIDDGYQTFQGDWQDQDPSWPTPLPDIAGKIRASGSRAGIWLMPFQASTASRIYREHPEYFVTDAQGEAVTRRGWSPEPDHLWLCLDLTKPAVQEYIAGIFRKFRDWGYTYFKMDGMNFGLMEGVRHDPQATPVSAFRLGLQAIRAAVPDCTLLGCTAPFLPCVGLVDMCRISSDTRACDSQIEHVYREISGRWWMFDRLFRADPDVLIARQDRGTQSLGASRISVLTGIITGVSLTSDNLAKIAPERLELLKCAAEYRLRDAVPLVWQQGSWIRGFAGTLAGRPAVALVNDTDAPLQYRLSDLGLAGPVEDLLQPGAGEVRRKYVLPPHDAALLVHCARRK